MSSRGKLSRRAFLRGAGGVAIGLPFLNLMGCTSRSGAAVDVGGTGGAAAAVGPPRAAGLFPKRFVAFFSANGTVAENWRPTGGETDFALSPILSPLEEHKQQLLILEGIDLESTRHGPGDNHQKGMGHLLSGIELLEGDEFTGGNGELVGWGGGITVDQKIANVVGGASKFKSLELGVQVFGANIWSRMCYAAPNQPIPPEDDPYAAFQRIFGDLGGDPLGLEKKIALRKSVLDTVGSDYGRLAPRLGAEDKQRLDAHLTAIRDIEARLDSGGQLGGACQKPVLGAPNVNDNDNYPLIGKLQMDLLVMALACDLTRVASLQWNAAVSNRVFSWLADPISEGHHDLSHFGDSDTGAFDKLTRINNWYAQQLAYLISEMKKVPEGESGTLMDNTVILWGNELARGNSHAQQNVPFVLAGSCGGALKTGRYLTYDGTVPHNNLLVSMMNAMDVQDQTFGNPAYCTGPLPRLT